LRRPARANLGSGSTVVRRRLLVCAALFLVAGGCTPLQTVPVQTAQSEAQRRLQRQRLGVLVDAVERDGRQAALWTGTWAALHTSLLIVQLALLPSSSDAERPDRIVGAAAAGVGLLSVTLAPHRALLERPRLRRALGAAPDGDEGLRVRLEAAEGAFARIRRDEAFNAGPLVHTGSFAFNAGLGLLLGAGLGRVDTGSLTTAVGILVGEAMLWTRPKGALGLVTPSDDAAMPTVMPAPARAPDLLRSKP
jgi:hypothetical protein